MQEMSENGCDWDEGLETLGASFTLDESPNSNPKGSGRTLPQRNSM
jgi:hypothetical protein